MEVGVASARGQDVPVTLTIEFKDGKMISTTGGDTVTATVKLDVVDGVKRMVLTDTKVAAPNGAPSRSEAFGYLLEENKLTLAQNQVGKAQKNEVDPKKPGDKAVVLKLTRVVER